MRHIQVKYPTHVAFHTVLFWIPDYMKTLCPCTNNYILDIFLIYNNDLPLENTSGKTLLFVDDSTITVLGKKIKLIKEHVSNEAISTKKWCYENGMALSFEKKQSYGNLIECKRILTEHKYKTLDKKNFQV